ncbi:MAG: M20/M25/M40 family metallo-hydrolase [Lachnospiraceae bacterium]|nr:M20/M25/M40 family metallo-hydrolase [Lachnospiraceae bacterium]
MESKICENLICENVPGQGSACECVLADDVRKYIDDHAEEFYELLVTLAQIPSPSHHEEKRAEFLVKLLDGWGAEGVRVDEALNVIIPFGAARKAPAPGLADETAAPDLDVFTAHTDVVFPDMTPLPFHMDGDRLCCPGIGDDTACVCAMLMVVKYMLDNHLSPKTGGVLFVCNSCEEGLGNLKGIRQICKDYGKRMRMHISFDGSYSNIDHRAVGSIRMRVTVRTCGGHSYSAFGNPNAIAHLASIISDLYQIEVPKRGRTTYNVGTIEGGTSVNTIAQQASMLCEFRSDDKDDLAEMQAHFDRIFEAHRSADVSVDVEVVGVRPCENLTEEQAAKREEMISDTKKMLERIYGKEVSLTPASTDCNIPLSLGIPALCFGNYLGHGAHTREEYILRSSLRPGYEVAFETVLRYVDL